MQFFDFHNHQTFHFFYWVCHSGVVDVETLVSRAFDMTHEEQPVEVHENLSDAVAQKLSELLVQVLESHVEAELVPVMGTGVSDCDAAHVCDYDPSLEKPSASYSERFALFIPLIRHALDQIAFQRVAVAILIRQKKWAP